ncbi:MAG: DUF2637 domain-containing protein [Anaerolineae bacterium]|nr:DUF2637 domain-containing protein [Anaerolineae bacterium]
MSKNIVPQSTLPDNGQPSPKSNNRIVTILFWFVALAVMALAAAAFALSFNALFELATKQGGVPKHLGWIWPVIVDLSLCVYTAAILVAQLQSRPAKLPVALVIFYALVTIVGNVLHAPPTPIGWFVASLPPLSLIFGTEILRTMAHHIIERQNVTASLADVTARRKTLTRETETLASKVHTLKAELAELRQEKKQFYAISENTREQARLILSERSDLSGKELGELLGKSASLGRKLKRELLPDLHPNGKGVTL